MQLLTVPRDHFPLHPFSNRTSLSVSCHLAAQLMTIFTSLPSKLDVVTQLRSGQWDAGRHIYNFKVSSLKRELVAPHFYSLFPIGWEGGAAILNPEGRTTCYRWQSPALLHEKEKQNKAKLLSYLRHCILKSLYYST